MRNREVQTQLWGAEKHHYTFGNRPSHKLVKSLCKQRFGTQTRGWSFELEGRNRVRTGELLMGDTWGCSGFYTKSSCHKQNKPVLTQKGKRPWQRNPYSEPPDVLDSAVLWISNFLYFGLTAPIPKAGSPQCFSRLYHAVLLLPCNLVSKPNSSVFCPTF